MSHGQSQDLTLLLRAVNQARSTLDLARIQMRGSATPEQRGLLTALEGYADALTSHGHPLPYRMRTELALYRAIFNSTRRHAR
jgi:hypothetical protein